MHPHRGCSIIPPHILRSIAERGDAADRDAAWASLESSAGMRVERDVYQTAAMLTIAPTVKRRAVYDARNGRVLPGRRLRTEGKAATGDKAADEAYDGAGRTYDFFREALGRNSIDDRGMRLESTVHYGVHYDNAQWNGRQMLYGDGDGKYFNRFTAALEVIGHELAHGVTQHTARLQYENQSGALNEHFSDVFGILVKQHAHGQTAAKSDWLIGKGLFTRRVHGAAVRSMKAPGTAYDDPIIGRDPQPAHMRDYRTMRYDNGGVHVNSGIPNHAFYLAATLLGGRAWQVAGRIWYHALTRKLRPASRFRDCAEATVASAAELFGARSEPAAAVRSAWKSVGVEMRVVSSRSRVKPAEYELPDAGGDAPWFPTA
jgi:Zn-dependent metalloprotease